MNPYKSPLGSAWGGAATEATLNFSFWVGNTVPGAQILRDYRARKALCGLWAVLAAVGLSGCDDPKEASARNFAKVIRQHLQASGDVCIERLTWPVVVEVSGLLAKFEDHPNSTLSQMVALEVAGMVSSTTETGVVRFNETVKKRVFQPTEAAQKRLRHREVLDLMWGGKKPTTDLCWGRMELADIRKWIGPQKMGPYEMVAVKYTYQLQDVPDWARSPQMLAAFPGIKSAIDGQGQEERNANLHLTNLGWEFNQ